MSVPRVLPLSIRQVVSEPALVTDAQGEPNATAARDSPPVDLSALRNGDATALGDCYRLHAQHLRTVALRLTGALEDAEDVVHDLFARLPSLAATYEERGQLRAWLTQLTIRASLMHRRRSRVRSTVSIENANAVAAPTVNGDPLAAARVLNALSALSPPLRHVFVLRAVHDFSHAEIAAALNISVSSSEVRLHRAIRKLRDFLEPVR
jgi:RNA polymerase sigma factor (sigma-70 family)